MEAGNWSCSKACLLDSVVGISINIIIDVIVCFFQAIVMALQRIVGLQYNYSWSVMSLNLLTHNCSVFRVLILTESVNPGWVEILAVILASYSLSIWTQYMDDHTNGKNLWYTCADSLLNCGGGKLVTFHQFPRQCDIRGSVVFSTQTIQISLC